MLIFRFLSGAVSMETVIKVNDLKSVSVVTTVNRKAHISIQMAPVWSYLVGLTQYLAQPETIYSASRICSNGG